MTTTPGTLPRHDHLADETVALVRRWLSEAAEVPVDKAASRLAAVLDDPAGLPFTVGFVDGVIRPEDPHVAAHHFVALAADVPRFVPLHLRAAMRLGALVARVAPTLVIPVVRRALRGMVGHLIVDATDRRLGRSIARLRRRGVRLNINLLGEAVLGSREADRRLAGTHALLARDDVDYVSIKVSSTVAPHSAWAFDDAVDHVSRALQPLFERVAAAPTPKFINLDMEEYRDLDLTMAVFMRILDQPHLLDLEAGIVLQAYLPDALAAMIRLQEWAAARRARGGAAVKVRLVKGANLPMERVEASLHDWPLATWTTKQESDTHYKRVLDYALRPERVENVRIGVAGHNLFDVAHAWLLAGERGAREGMELEMLLGMAQQQAEVVRRDVGGLLLYTPVVHPREFDVAIAYLIRRLEEGASHDNFMSAIFALHDDEALFERERQRFLASLADVDDEVPTPRRTQDRNLPPVPPTDAGFANAPDTDPALPANRRWAEAILQRVPTSSLGVDTVEAHRVVDVATLDTILGTARTSGVAWGQRSGAERAEVLERVAHRLEERRGELMEVMAAETGKTLDQSDPEVSEAIDFARYYAQLARELDTVDGATFVPSALTVVTPPWNFPVAIPAGSTLAALAAGSAVVVKPAPQAARCGSVMVEALWEAGVPRDVLHLVHVPEDEVGRRLVSDPRVDRLVLTGAYETAALFRSFRPDLPLLAETSGKNAIVVTPSADLDLAARDVAHSAFAHAGQKCSAASLVILVGSVATSERFRAQLVDAVTSLVVGLPDDPTSQVGPLVEPAHGKLLTALTTLDPGEEWLVEPRALDAAGRQWTPGIRTGVRRGSTTHLVEFFGPVLGVMTAATLEEAVEIQNQVDYGLTAGLHSLDPDEIGRWLDGVHAGNLYVNRGITGAIVRRQPFGGWKKSAVGAGHKAGGPNYLVGLGSWTSAVAHADAEPLSPGRRLLEAAGGDARLERALRSDAAASRDVFAASDVSALMAERNVFRYLPATVHVRLAEAGDPADLLRTVAAALAADADLTVSSAVDLPALASVGVEVVVEDDAAWAAGLPNAGHQRIRLVGAAASVVAQALDGRPDVAVFDHPVVESGRVERLPYVLEQAVSITAHRFGTPDHLTDDVLVTA